MKKNNLETLYSIILSKKENLQEKFDFWLIEKNIHRIKGIKKLLSICNEDGFMNKYMIIENPLSSSQNSPFISVPSSGYTVTTNLIHDNDSFLVIPKKLAEKLLSLESFKNNNKNNI